MFNTKLKKQVADLESNNSTIRKTLIKHNGEIDSLTDEVKSLEEDIDDLISNTTKALGTLCNILSNKLKINIDYTDEGFVVIETKKVAKPSTRPSTRPSTKTKTKTNTK